MSFHASSLLSSLQPTHPAYLQLLKANRPFAVASAHSQLSKLVQRLNTVLLSKEYQTEQRATCNIAAEIISQDEQGWVMAEYGKGWMSICLGCIASPSTPIVSIPPYLKLITLIVLSSAHLPSFERANVHPVMGKLSVSLGKVLERCLSQAHPDWDVVLCMLESLHSLVLHSPATFRPMTSSLKVRLFSLVFSQSTGSDTSPACIPRTVIHASANLLACLSLTAGKAQSPAVWSTDMRDLLAAFRSALSSVSADGWGEILFPAVLSPSILPSLPHDPLLRIPLALDWAENLSQCIRAMFLSGTFRPVAVPISGIVNTALQCLGVGADTPTLEHISPQHQALLVTSLPRIWSLGIETIGALCIVAGDHFLPHLPNTLNHSVWLLERVPLDMLESQSQLLAFHRLLFICYSPSLIPTEHIARLLRFSLSTLSPLLEMKKGVIVAQQTGNGGGGGKKNKKRARGAEDGLVGNLEGRSWCRISPMQIQLIKTSLAFAPLLHNNPSLSPSLVTLSVRLHLSLYLSLSSLEPLLLSAKFATELKDLTGNFLERLLVEGEGWGKGYEGLIVSVIDPDTAAARHTLRSVLHPKLPPMLRNQPPLSHLNFFTTEGEEEKREREDLGLEVIGDEREVMDRKEKDERVLNEIVSSTDLQEQVTRTMSLVARTPLSNPTTLGVDATATISISASAPILAAAPAPIHSQALVPVSALDPNPTATQQISTSSSDFISFSSTSRTASLPIPTSTLVEPPVLSQDGDEEGIPELDSGSDDDALMGDEDDD
ncbi:uncharacterized protein L203_103846 [Cryptococcus depauperatus CBS 7841]|uniref:Pre-rRNA-processing protein RIX1 n=1 Tax=Cryptococcus depauperatus CBS 7841 TaxID=1295531 RepID=A0AAJ8M1Q1_9TREE